MAEHASTDVHEQALEWLVIFWSGEVTEQQRQEWQRWLGTSREHEQAWALVQQLQQKLQGIPPAIASSTLRQPLKSVKRRKLLQAMVVLLATGTSVQVARETALWQNYMADYSTSTGELRHITLADGSKVSLNTSSAIDVFFNEHERRIILREGEVFVTTAPDTAAQYRPFIVETRHGIVRALGTRFSVRQFAGHTRVAVLQHAVEVTPKHHMAIRLGSGQQAIFSASHISAASKVSDQEHAWLDGWLVAERMRLEDFLAEVSRYRTGVIRCDEQAANLIVSGVFPVQDTDRILKSLHQALPISISYRTRYWVTVHAA